MSAAATTSLRADQTCDWNKLADLVLDGHRVTMDEGLAILKSSDDELLG